jgi:hypothetical protein
MLRGPPSSLLWGVPTPVWCAPGGADFVLVDHDNKRFERVTAGKDDMGKLEDRVNFLMNMPIRVAAPVVDKVVFSAKKSGILGMAFDTATAAPPPSSWSLTDALPTQGSGPTSRTAWASTTPKCTRSPTSRFAHSRGVHRGLPHYYRHMHASCADARTGPDLSTWTSSCCPRRSGPCRRRVRALRHCLRP